MFNSGARPHSDFRSQHHGVRGLAKENPEPTVTLNLRDAGQRGIETGDLVEVRTPRGAVPFRARVTADIVGGAVECNMGGGTPVGPEAWREWNVNELTDLGNFDEISGFPVYKSLLCQVVKIEDGTPASRHVSGNGVAAPVSPPSTGKLTGPNATRRVYLDNNATTRVAEAVRDAMLPHLEATYGNPSSIHGAGRDAREAVATARRQVARLIGARPRQIVFTAGGSESDNLALKGVAFSRTDRGRHIITSAIEHPAVLGACRFLETQGYRVTYLEVDDKGRVRPERLRGAIAGDTVLVSIMMANNEVGTVQPIRELCAIAHERDVLFHTDAVQAVGKVKVDVEDLGVDLLSLSGHKLHGPKGVGALFVRKGVKLEPLVHGGKQEGGVRAGTENVPAIVGLGKAAELAFGSLQSGQTSGSLRDRLERGLLDLVPGARVNGDVDSRLPNTSNLTLPGLRGESLVVAMDRHGVSLSSGSACKSGSPEPTHVLLAMGLSPEEAHCAVRLSLSHETSEKDVDWAVDTLGRVIEEMETTVRFLPCK